MKLSRKKITAAVMAVALLVTLVIGGTLAYFTDTTITYKNTFTAGKVELSLTETSDGGESDDKSVKYIAGTEKEGEDEHGFDYGTFNPGEAFSKQPVITLEQGSEDAYVFAEITVEGYHELHAALEALAEKETEEGVETAKYPADDLSRLLLERDASLDSETNIVDAWMPLEDGSTNETDTKDEFHVVYVLKTKVSSGTEEVEEVEVAKAENAWTLFKAVQIPAGFTSDIIKGAGLDDKNININVTGYAVQASGFSDAQTAWDNVFKKDDSEVSRGENKETPVSGEKQEE